MRVCNLFVLPAARESNALEKRRHGKSERQRSHSWAEQPLLVGHRPTLAKTHAPLCCVSHLSPP